MNNNQLASAVIFIAHGGGSISCQSQDGKVMAWDRGFAPGRYQAKDLLRDIPPGFTLVAGPGASIMVPESRVRRASYGPGATDSGANPDFRPSRMTDQEAQLRKLMTDVSRKSSALQRRLDALEANQARVPAPLPFPVPEKDAAELEVEPESAGGEGAEE